MEISLILKEIHDVTHDVITLDLFEIFMNPSSIMVNVSFVVVAVVFFLNFSMMVRLLSIWVGWREGEGEGEGEVEGKAIGYVFIY